uniref:Transposase domain-containing protein n=1 Tax=Phakopsora pachyrhizi TaxID=170000 RepID=A0JPS1_PHAPC|nr:TPA: transposase domain-containing protein [Phakopsora pachyrhizi]
MAPIDYSKYIICLCEVCEKKTHSSPHGTLPGIPYTKPSYIKHLAQINHAESQKTVDDNEEKSSNTSENSNQNFPSKTFSFSSNLPALNLQQNHSIPQFDANRFRPLDWRYDHKVELISMVICSILSLFENISHTASRFLLQSTRILIYSMRPNTENLKGHSLDLPKDPETVYKQLNLETDFQTYVCCPECFYLESLVDDVQSSNISCSRHMKTFDDSPQCSTILGHFSVSNNQNEKLKKIQEKKFIPIKPFVYHPFKLWLARFLLRPGIFDKLEAHKNMSESSSGEKCDIWDGKVWKKFNGTRNRDDLPFMLLPGSLAFSLYIDWFNAFGKSSRSASIGPIVLACLNLPPEERLKPENIYIAAIIPGPNEPTGPQLNHLLVPLINKLKELWKGVHLFPTSKDDSGTTIRVVVLTAIADVVAMRKLTGFISHSENYFCNFCTIHKDLINNIGTECAVPRTYKEHKKQVQSWISANQSKRKVLFSNYGVRYSILEELPYWDATKMVNLDIMHNLILGALKDHATYKLQIPESVWKPSYYKGITQNSTETTDSESDDEIISRNELRDLKKNANKRLDVQSSSMAGPSNTPNAIHHLSHSGIPTSVLTERYDDEDPDYIPLSDSESNDSKINLDQIHEFQIGGPRLELLREIISQTSIPSISTRLPKKIGAASHGSLKAAEWSMLYKVYIPIFFMVSLSLNSPIEEALLQNTFHLISAINIATSWNITPESTDDFARHWRKYRYSSQKLFPNQRSKPNHHLAEHIPELFLRWGPSASTATWAYERLNGILGKYHNNNKIGMAI